MKVRKLIDGHEFQVAFMAMGGGVHMLPIKAETRRPIGKEASDSVEMILTKHL